MTERVFEPRFGFLVIDGVKYRGNVFQIGEQKLPMFRLFVLGKALRCHSETIRRWEDEGLFPAPLYVSKLRGQACRLYSSIQILNIAHIMEACRCNFQAKGPKHQLNKQKFFKAVKLVFAKEEVLPYERRNNQEAAGSADHSTEV